MGFVFRAVFWLAVVAAFMPRDAYAEPVEARGRQLASSPIIDADAAASRLCSDQPELCAVGVEVAALGRAAGEVAIDAALSVRADIAAQ